MIAFRISLAHQNLAFVGARYKPIGIPERYGSIYIPLGLPLGENKCLVLASRAGSGSGSPRDGQAARCMSGIQNTSNLSMCWVESGGLMERDMWGVTKIIGVPFSSQSPKSAYYRDLKLLITQRE